MKPKTEKLLQQCRSALLQYSNEQLNTLFMSWFERVMCEESMDEALDDLCLLLGYAIYAVPSQVQYSTYTAWWEVEGSEDPNGEFVCLDVAALQQYLITMPIKQFYLISELAHQACMLEAEVEGQPSPLAGQEWLRALAVWLSQGAQEPFHKQIHHKGSLTPSPVPQPQPQQLSRNQLKAQQHAVSRAAYEARQRELEEVNKPTWMKAITRLSAQEQAIPELAESVVLPKEWASLLSKEQLGAFLTFLKLPASSREIKANLVQHLSSHLESNKTAKAQFFEVFVHELAVPPWELETLLGCTTTERKRWTEEKKLPVLRYGSFRRGGSDYEYPIYDRRFILTLTSNNIELWRSEHQACVRERRRAAAQAAAASRKAKRQEDQMVHKNDLMV